MSFFLIMSLTKSYFPKPLKRHLIHTLSLSSFNLYLLRIDTIYSKLKTNSHLMLQPVSFHCNANHFTKWALGRSTHWFTKEPQATRYTGLGGTGPRYQPCTLVAQFSQGPLCVPQGEGRTVGSDAEAAWCDWPAHSSFSLPRQRPFVTAQLSPAWSDVYHH